MDGRMVLAALVLAVAGGCSSGPPPLSTGLASATGAQPASPMPPAPKPAAKARPGGSDLEALLQQSALDTQRALDELNAPKTAVPSAPATTAATTTNQPAVTANPPLSTPAREPAATAPQATVAPALLASPEHIEVEAGPPSPLETREGLAARLSSVLRADGGGTASWSDLLTLAGLEAAAPGGLAAQVGTMKGLTEPQKKALLAIPALLGAIPADADASRVLAERAEALAEQLAELRPLGVRAELCRRVVGFGSYTTFGGVNRFPAGTEQRAIVYVEVANLAQRELSIADTSLARQPGDRYLVDLTQETNLFNESGSLLALHVPEQRLTETSRNRRRDFFLVSQVTLPPSLSIGLYNLKVTVRDRVSGAEAEASIAIEIVAGR